jgi:hypothetical protein
MTFSKVLNGVGPHSCSLNLEDKQVRRADWARATARNRSAAWIDIDGALLYGGRNTGRTHSLSSGILSVTGSDFCGYLSQRVQAMDYKTYTDPEGHHWALAPGAPVPRIAYYILIQALEKAFSIPINVEVTGSAPDEEFWTTFSLPEEQQQSLASLLSQFQGLGYLVGIDYTQKVSYVNGLPTVTITLAYPRLGTVGSRKSVVVESSSILDWEWDEDGTGQGNRIIELAGATKFRLYAVEWKKALEEGYPLLEIVESHSALAPSGADAAVLKAYGESDLAALAYGLVTPVITLPMFGYPSITELDVGDDILFRVPVTAGQQPQNNPLFPEGLEYYFRIVRIDCEIPDEGVPLMKLSLAPPPGLFPVPPPEMLSNPSGGGEEWEEKEKEREEKEKEEKEKEEEEKEKEEEEKEKEEEEKEKEEEEKLLGEGTVTLFSENLFNNPEVLTRLLAENLPLIAGSISEVESSGPEKNRTTVTKVEPSLPGGTVRVVLTQVGGPSIGPKVVEGTDIKELYSYEIPTPGSPITTVFHYRAFS